MPRLLMGLACCLGGGKQSSAGPAKSNTEEPKPTPTELQRRDAGPGKEDPARACVVDAAPSKEGSSHKGEPHIASARKPAVDTYQLEWEG